MKVLNKTRAVKSLPLVSSRNGEERCVTRLKTAARETTFPVKMSALPS